MAPQKRTRDGASRNRDKTRRRKRPTEHMLYKCLGQLCGEECDQDLQMISNGSRPARRDPKQQRKATEETEMDAMTEASDEEYKSHRGSNVQKAGRVSKTKLKKSTPDHTNEIPLKIGVQKAKHYLCAALDFGVQSGFLTPKDSKGQVLRVSSELLHQKSPAPPPPPITKSRIIKRLDAEGLESRRLDRKRLRESPENFMAMDSRASHASHASHAVVDGIVRQKSSRSHSRRGIKKRSAKSRSRSRSRSKSKRPSAHVRKRAIRSRSINGEPDPRLKQIKPEGGHEQSDALAESNKEGEGSNNRHDEDNDDSKSLKSTKMEKLDPNNEAQKTSEEKTNAEDDGSLSGGSDYDEIRK